MIIKYGGDKLQKIYAYCDEHTVTERDIGGQCAAMTILSAGGQGSLGHGKYYSRNPAMK